MSEREQNWYPIDMVGWFTEHVREGVSVPIATTQAAAYLNHSIGSPTYPNHAGPNSGADQRRW